MKNCIFHSVACVDHYKNNNISQLQKKKHLIKNREQEEKRRERKKKDQFSKRWVARDLFTRFSQ